MSDASAEKIACLEVFAAAANLDGDPTPLEFEAFLAALNTFQPVPPGMTPERLLTTSLPDLTSRLSLIQTVEWQQQVYRGVFAIVRSKGIDPQEAQLLADIKAAFGLSAEITQALEKQPLFYDSAGTGGNSALAGMASLIGREGDVRRMIFDYAMGAAIVGLVPLTGGGTLEIKLLILLGLILKMIWDIRQLWGQPQGQDILAIIGQIFGVMGAAMGGLLAWGTMIGVSAIVPYAGAFAKAAGFATATWVAGQATNQFYTSQKRPDLAALKRAFPNLLSSDES